MSGFTYEPLDIQRREIRLLSVAPAAAPSEPVSCQLKTASLLASPKYHALSYVWGGAASADNPSPANNVRLNNALVPVTKNLLAALRHLRLVSPSQTSCLWVDSLCINQHDTAERSQQVSMMRDIYATAERVVIWLGEGSLISDAAFDNLARCATTPGYATDNQSRLQILRKMSSFYFTLVDEYPWFNRIWILQELAVAQNDPLVVCGQKSAPWSLLVQVWDAIAQEVFVEIGLARPAVREITSHGQPNPSDETPAIQSQTPNQSNPEPRPDLKIDVLQGLRVTTRCKGGERLSKLLRLSRTSESTDPRDRIYGLLGLLHKDQTHGTAIPIDYEKSTSQVYIDAMAHMLSLGQGLFFLSGSFLPGIDADAPRIVGVRSTSQQKLPSWVPDFSRQMAEMASQPSGILFYPPDILTTGGASGAGAECINGKCLNDRRTLQAEGLQVDNIRQLVPLGDSLDACIAGLPHLDFLAKRAKEQAVNAAAFGASTPFIERFKRNEPLWRVLVSNKAFNSGYNPAPESYADTYEELLSRKAGAWADIPDSERAPYELCLKAGVTKRSFFVSENGFVGTCVPDAREGDIIAILFGSPVPFVLRDLGKTVSVEGNNKQVYGLIGGAYVGGIMNGEMVDELYCEDVMDSTTFFIQ